MVWLKTNEPFSCHHIYHCNYLSFLQDYHEEIRLLGSSVHAITKEASGKKQIMAWDEHSTNNKNGTVGGTRTQETPSLQVLLSHPLVVTAKTKKKTVVQLIGFKPTPSKREERSCRKIKQDCKFYGIILKSPA